MPRKPRPAPSAKNECLAVFYLLDANGDVQPTTDARAWSRALESDRVVASDDLGEGDTGIFISTVFVGIDMDYANIIQGAPHTPMVFETMVFWPGGRRLIDRYTTRAKALEAHQAVVAALKNDRSLLDES